MELKELTQELENKEHALEADKGTIVERDKEIDLLSGKQEELTREIQSIQEEKNSFQIKYENEQKENLESKKQYEELRTTLLKKEEEKIMIMTQLNQDNETLQKQILMKDSEIKDLKKKIEQLRNGHPDFEFIDEKTDPDILKSDAKVPSTLALTVHAHDEKINQICFNFGSGDFNPWLPYAPNPIERAPEIAPNC